MMIRWSLILSREHILYDELSILEKFIYNIVGFLSVMGVIIFPLLGLIWCIIMLWILF